MHITELRIRNFRNFKKSRFRFLPGVNTLIGENGAGKTNALHALRLLLDESLARNAGFLRESDFCRELGDWRGHWIVIAVDFAGLDPSEGCQLLRHTTAHMDESDTGTCTFFFRPKAEVRKHLSELASEGKEVLDYRASLTIDEYVPVITGRAQGDFLDDEIYNKFVGDAMSLCFPDPGDDDLDLLGVGVQSIHQEVACTFVRALRDVVAELRSYRGNPLLTLLRGMESEIEIADSNRIVEKVAALNDDISSLDEIKGLASGIETVLRDAVGHTYAPGVTIESALPDSMDKLLQRLSVLVGDSASSDYRGELYEQSLGGANLIYLALKLLEYETKLSSDRVAHFLLIEEPESHIHTHVQKALFNSLPSENTQVIVSTHSTHISSAARIESVNVLAKKRSHAEVYAPDRGLEATRVDRIGRYLDAVRSTLLFAKGVLLVEGDAEQILIPYMLRAVFGLSPDELGFSVISMNSAFFEHIAVIFGEERIRRPCAIVTDLDVSLLDLSGNPEDDGPAEAHARAAEEVGTRRRKTLDELESGNPWIRVFYAEHTFEVEFVAADNSWEVTQALDGIFTQQAARTRSGKKLESENLQVAGREILRLADKVGKGWFALMLAEKLVAKTYIPEYILRAIAFACHQSVPSSALRQIGMFRLNSGAVVESEERTVERSPRPLANMNDLSTEDFISRFCSSVPDDSFSLFCEYVEEYREGDLS